MPSFRTYAMQAVEGGLPPSEKEADRTDLAFGISVTLGGGVSLGVSFSWSCFISWRFQRMDLRHFLEVTKSAK